MSSDLILEFVNYMSKMGCAPRNSCDIQGDDTRRNYQLSDDPNMKKRGFYILSIQGDFAYGYFGDYREDKSYAWSCNNAEKYTQEEIAEFKARAERQRKQRQKEREELLKRTAGECSDFVVLLNEWPVERSNAYLERKKISPCGALKDGNDLIIPMRYKTHVVNYQRIKPDGFKMFQKNALVTGSYYIIGALEEGKRALICEGYATGASLHMATGLAVVVTFNAGNLEAATGQFIEDYGHIQLVLCCDNDHETVIRGDKVNVGLVKGKIVANKFKIPYIYPKFENGEKLSDFNDLHVAEGLDQVVAQISPYLLDTNITEDASVEGVPDATLSKGGEDLSRFNPLSIEANSPPPSYEWREKLSRDKKGVKPRSSYNLKLIMNHAEDLRGVFRYDEFAKETMVTRCPPWEEEATFQVRRLADYDFFNLEVHLEQEHGLLMGVNKCAASIDEVAKSKENAFNPAIDYFQSLQWDGKPRLDTWLRDYVCDLNSGQSDKYLKMVGSKFMCGLAARAMKPGCKFDTMIVFEGPQYAGKSYLSRIMSTVNGVEYFLDDFKDIDNKDALMKMQGKLIIEFSELSTMRKAEVNDLKAFISRQEDDFRMPYGRVNVRSPRQCVFIGTVNPEGPYLRDVTGNRRYWPVACRPTLPLDELKKIMPLLHAEAAHRVKEGEILHLTKPEYEMASVEQKKRVQDDAWTDIIEEAVGNKDKITLEAIYRVLMIDPEKRNKMNLARINQVMTSLGYVTTRVQLNLKRVRGFKRVETLR